MIAALKKSYVWPDVAGKLEKLLTDRLRTGAYDRVTSAIAFADQLTKDLQSVSHDYERLLQDNPKFAAAYASYGYLLLAIGSEGYRAALGVEQSRHAVRALLDPARRPAPLACGNGWLPS